MKRPHMPDRVKIAAVCMNIMRHGTLKCEETRAFITLRDVIAGRLHFDHSPPLAIRYRHDDGTFSPDANDLGFIDVVSVDGHNIRTNKKRGLQHGDQTAIAKMKRLRAKNGLDPAKPKKKRKIPSKPFPKKQRPCKREQTRSYKSLQKR